MTTPLAPAHWGQARTLAVLVTALWSSSWLLIRWGIGDDVSPLHLAGLRYSVAACALACWVAVRRPRSIAAPAQTQRRRAALPWRQLVVLGLVQYSITQGAQFVAIANQPAATTTLFLAATPLLVAVAGALIGEPMTRSQLVAGGLIIVGACTYFAGDLGATPVGVAAASIGLFGNTAAALLGRRVNRDHGVEPTVLTLTTMSIGALALVVTSIVADGAPRLTPGAVGVVLWLAVINTAAAFTWWNRVLRTLPATDVAAINTLMMPQIALLGWVFLGEPLGPAELAGLAIVLAAVFLAARAPGTRGPRSVRRRYSRGRRSCLTQLAEVHQSECVGRRDVGRDFAGGHRDPGFT